MEKTSKTQILTQLLYLFLGVIHLGWGAKQSLWFKNVCILRRH